TDLRMPESEDEGGGVGFGGAAPPRRNCELVGPPEGARGSTFGRAGMPKALLPVTVSVGGGVATLRLSALFASQARSSLMRERGGGADGRPAAPEMPTR